jgi:glucose dehydrogenase
MGILYALDEQTGTIKWSFNTVQNGNLWGNPKVNSGGGAWYPPALDTSTGTTYWGTGNPAPVPGTAQYPNGSSRPGPNLYTDSELAISSSGKLLWYQQITPHDNFDHDFEASPILTTATTQGTQRQVVIGAGKEGEVVAFDAQTGAVLWKTAVGLHLNDEVQNVPPGQTITILPGASGGVQTPRWR